MKQGPTEKQIIDSCIKRGQPLPEALANAPELLRGLDFYYNAFSCLNTCRQLGMGAGAIPWTAVSDYANRQALDQEEFEDLWDIMQRMDGAYLKHQSDSSKSSAGKQEL